ncbi:MAG: GNAT family N-acetyltransferase [Mesorhizobium sp.]|nr:MAG: GNAT family N-acetyltransferase [Mesorhizobium sp.]
MHVTRLDLDGIPVATGLGLQLNSSYSLVMSSYQEEFAKYSPGRQHIQEIMQYAIGQKMQKFDFTIGDEPYKLSWSDINSLLFFHFDSRTLRGRIVIAMKMAINYVDTWYNQTPLLKPPLRQVLRKTRRSLHRMFL